MSLSGQVVVITGASAGIGRTTCEHLASHQAKLALVARSRDKLVEVKSKCIENGAKEEDVLLVEGDVSKKEDLPRIIQDVVSRFGRLDHLVNNAAILAYEDVENATFEVFESVINTNLRAPLFLTKEALPHLKETKGSIINISSTTGQTPLRKTAVYSMSKMALEHLTKITALEVAKSGVRVNTIAPGWVITDTALAAYPPEKKKVMAKTMVEFGKTAQPLGGAMFTSDVSKVIHFLLSDAASSITGECIRVDNGYHLLTEKSLETMMPTNTGVQKPPSAGATPKAGDTK